MADVSGPTSSMPGSIHELPLNSRCDEHSNCKAVVRIQGETDSFGAEYYDMCQVCLDKYRKEVAKTRDRLGTCEWCKTNNVKTRPYRDFEEGMSGRLYDVCAACVRKEYLRLLEE